MLYKRSTTWSSFKFALLKSQLGKIDYFAISRNDSINNIFWLKDNVTGSGSLQLSKYIRPPLIIYSVS